MSGGYPGGTDFKEWLTEVMLCRPKGNEYLESDRGIEIGQLCIDLNREMFSWRRADPDVFWIDVMLYTKYNFSDGEVDFVEHFQPGVEQFKKHSQERNAYAEMMRGMQKLRQILGKKKNDNEN